jgi:hypothetical protein
MTLPTLKQCTACGGTDSTEDNPLICYGHIRTGVTIGWVHHHCRELLLKGIEAMDDELRR